MRKMAFALLALGVALAPACSSDEGSTPEGSGGGGEESNVSPVKSDCPDCDPAGPNAFVQTGVGSGFYTRDNSWQLAVSFRHGGQQEKRPELLVGQDETVSDVFLFGYRVLQVDKDVFANVLRDTVTIEVTQATPTGQHADLFSSERLDRHEMKVEFVMNDLLDPIRETVFNRDYPNGKRIELDSKASLRTGASLFPRTIPRVLREGGIDSPAPELPVDLRDVADVMVPGWESASYVKYSFDNGDTVFWKKDSGEYWPFYTETRHSRALLVSWN